MTALTRQRGTLASRLLDTDPGDDWRARGVCHDEDPDLFFPAGESGPAHRGQVAAAKRVCRRCPVTVTCEQWAVDHSAVGIWGGTTDSERRRRRQQRPAAIPRSDWEATVRAMAAARRSDTQIAAHLGVHHDTVYRLRQQYRIPAGRPDHANRWTADEDDTLRRMAAAGATDRHIAAMLGRTHTAVQQRRLGRRPTEREES